MNYRSLADLNRDVLQWLETLPGDIEVFVGIPRSGMLVANMLALYANVYLSDVDGLLMGRLVGLGRTKALGHIAPGGLDVKRRVLVVDDSVLSGMSMDQARDSIRRAALPHEILFGAVYVAPGSEKKIDLYYECLPCPRVFQWNLMHSLYLERACVDIDGVLCRDPAECENDDGARYEQFLRGVPPRCRPSQKIGCLVTCRLDKYRAITEQWLSVHRISYDRLVMMNLPDKETRVALGAHSTFKASVYSETGAALFVESSRFQAAEIARLSGKFVLCWETGRLVAPNKTAERLQEVANLARIGKVRLKARMPECVRKVYRLMRYGI